MLNFLYISKKNTVKKLIYLFLSVLIVACSSDDSSDDSNSIEGRWNLTSALPCSFSQGLNSCNLQSYITFNNGVCEIFNYVDDGMGTPCELQVNTTSNYSTDSNIPNTYYIDGKCNDEDSTVTAKLNGNTLSFFQECGNCTMQEANVVFTRD